MLDHACTKLMPCPNSTSESYQETQWSLPNTSILTISTKNGSVRDAIVTLMARAAVRVPGVKTPQTRVIIGPPKLRDTHTSMKSQNQAKQGNINIKRSNLAVKKRRKRNQLLLKQLILHPLTSQYHKLKGNHSSLSVK